MTRRSLLRDLTGWLGLLVLGAVCAVSEWVREDDPDRMSGREFAGCWLVVAVAAAAMILWLCVGG